MSQMIMFAVGLSAISFALPYTLQMEFIAFVHKTILPSGISSFLAIQLYQYVKGDIDGMLSIAALKGTEKTRFVKAFRRRSNFLLRFLIYSVASYLFSFIFVKYYHKEMHSKYALQASFVLSALSYYFVAQILLSFLDLIKVRDKLKVKKHEM